MGSFLHQGYNPMLFYLIVFNIWTCGRDGLIQLPAKEPYPLGTAGSNPATSAKSGTLSKRNKGNVSPLKWA